MPTRRELADRDLELNPEFAIVYISAPRKTDAGKLPSPTNDKVPEPDNDSPAEWRLAGRRVFRDAHSGDRIPTRRLELEIALRS